MQTDGKNLNLKVMKYYTIIQAVTLLNYGTYSICVCLNGKMNEVRIGQVQYSLNGQCHEIFASGFFH